MSAWIVLDWYSLFNIQFIHYPISGTYNWINTFIYKFMMHDIHEAAPDIAQAAIQTGHPIMIKLAAIFLNAFGIGTVVWTTLQDGVSFGLLTLFFVPLATRVAVPLVVLHFQVPSISVPLSV